MSLRIFVTGAHGQIARSLIEAAAQRTDVVVGHGTRPGFDLARPETIAGPIEVFRPDIVVNPAAYTAVDRAESEPEAAYAVNRDGARAVAAAAAAVGAPIIQLSTDYVFDGSRVGAYKEDDPVAPLGVYGRSKLEGERAVAAANPSHVILRTAWVYAPFGVNFVRTMLRLAAERDSLRVVDDQTGSPTYAPDIADAIVAIGHSIAGPRWRPEFAGVTHIAGPDALSWCAFARLILRAASVRGGKAPPVTAITTAEYPTIARRPVNSRLDTTRLADMFDVRLPPLASSLDRCLDRLIGPVRAAGGD